MLESVGGKLPKSPGNQVEGYQLSRADPFRGDFQYHLMSWEGESDLSPLQRKRIRIRFSMKNAKFYSFRLA